MGSNCANAIPIHGGRVQIRAGIVEAGGGVQRRRHFGGLSGASEQQHDAGTQAGDDGSQIHAPPLSAKIDMALGWLVVKLN